MLPDAVDPLFTLFPQVTGPFSQWKREVDDAVGLLKIQTHGTRLVLYEGHAVLFGFVRGQILGPAVHDAYRAVTAYTDQFVQFPVEVVEHHQAVFRTVQKVPERLQLFTGILSAKLSCV